jgi:hypothetical protein
MNNRQAFPSISTTLWRLSFVGAALVLFSGAGCNSLSHRESARRTPPKSTDGPDLDVFYSNWNDNTKKIKSLKYDGVKLDIHGDNQPLALNARLAYQNDNKFFLTAGVAGNTRAELGSNEREIWFWFKDNKNPAVYKCDRSDLAGADLGLPIHPDWVIEALGVKPLDRASYRLDRPWEKGFTLVSYLSSPTGDNLVKRILVDSSTNRIRQFELWNVSKKPTAESVVRMAVEQYFDDEESAAFVPKQFTIYWREPGEKGERYANFAANRKIEVNRLSDEIAANVFQRKSYNNAEVVNLGRIAQQNRRAPDAGARSRQGFLRAAAESDASVESTSRSPAEAAPDRPIAELTGEINSARRTRGDAN